jgi:hypothetical protein
MTRLESTHLFDVHLELGAIDSIGQTPYGHRVVGNLGGGHFEGERLSGRVLPSGGDWGLFLPDGTLVVDGRATYETQDGALFYVIYAGRWAIAPEMMARLNDPENPVDPSEYYLRIHMSFETAAPACDWLNRIIAVGRGRHVGDAIDYEVFEIR